MKHLLSLFILLFLVQFSFAQEVCPEGQCLSATLNGVPFQFRDYWQVNTLLDRQQASMDGRQPGKTIIKITLNGISYEQKNGVSFSENIEFEIEYEEGKIGVPLAYTVSSQYQSGLYSIVKEQSVVTITAFTWEADHQSFRLYATANCFLRAWGNRIDDKANLQLQSTLSNILIAVPGWLVAKN